ncbi:unnamed protein product [Notodromas monacha]|uniref:PHD-type domain-containing protein n=1 Tax=Notodromas monacha TaxID=399045 RepID=A0A7R9BFX2_9CRUS|nr:unnamed protein product [Notodromas monacha]CAG0913109.1 unnamed protein product [Notodromas monacha]
MQTSVTVLRRSRSVNRHFRNLFSTGTSMCRNRRFLTEEILEDVAAKQKVELSVPIIELDTVERLEKMSLVNFGNKLGLLRLIETVRFAGTLKTVNTEGVEPLISVLENRFLHLREDLPIEFSRKEILSCAAETEENYFVAPPGNIEVESKSKELWKAVLRVCDVKDPLDTIPMAKNEQLSENLLPGVPQRNKIRAIYDAAEFNARFNLERRKRRPCAFDLQSFNVVYPLNKILKVSPEKTRVGNYPVAMLPTQRIDSISSYFLSDLGFLMPNNVLPDEEMNQESNQEFVKSKVAQCEDCICPEAKESLLSCSECHQVRHIGCWDLNRVISRSLNDNIWKCPECKPCSVCDDSDSGTDMLFCDFCDRGFHPKCIGMSEIPDGTWNCHHCNRCLSCSSSPSSSCSQLGSVPRGNRLSRGNADWDFELVKDPGKVGFSVMLCKPCARFFRNKMFCSECFECFAEIPSNVVKCGSCFSWIHFSCCEIDAELKAAFEDYHGSGQQPEQMKFRACVSPEYDDNGLQTCSFPEQAFARLQLTTESWVEVNGFICRATISPYPKADFLVFEPTVSRNLDPPWTGCVECKVEVLKLRFAKNVRVTLLHEGHERESILGLEKCVKAFLEGMCIVKHCYVELCDFGVFKFAKMNVMDSVDENDAFIVDGKTKLFLNDSISVERLKCSRKLEAITANLLELDSFSKARRAVKEIFDMSDVLEKELKRLGNPISRGILLSGVSGVGKTAVVHLVCHLVNALCIAVDPTTVADADPGESEKRLEAVFKNALAHCVEGKVVLLFDPVEVFCPASRKPRSLRLALKFLSLLDCELPQSRNLFVVGVTGQGSGGCHERLASPGRLASQVSVDLPTTSDINWLLKKLLDGAIEDSEEIARKLSLNSPGYSLTDVENLARSLWEARPLSPDIIHAVHNRIQPQFSLARKFSVSKAVKLTWDSIGGLADVKSSLRRALEWPLLHKNAFKRLGIHKTGGILLYGPPGCGKTRLVRTAASEVNAHFFALGPADVFSPFVGDSEKTIVEVFRMARRGKRSIVFIDEIDAMVGSRGSGQIKRVHEAVLSALLNEMDGICGRGLDGEEEGDFMTVVAATNRPSALDSALLRPGRFDMLIHVPTPDVKSRLDVLKSCTQKMPLNDDVDLSRIADGTEGWSSADLENLVRETAMEAISMSATSVSQNLFLEVFAKSPKSSVDPKHDLVDFLLYLIMALTHKAAARAVLFQRRVLIGTTGVTVVGLLIWIIAIATDYWFIIDSPQGSLNPKTGLLFLRSNRGIWHVCTTELKNTTTASHNESNPNVQTAIILTTCKTQPLFPSKRTIRRNQYYDETLLDFTRTEALFAFICLILMLLGIGFSVYTFKETRYMYKRLAGAILFITAAAVFVVLEVSTQGVEYARTHFPAVHPENASWHYGFSYMLAWLVFIIYLGCGITFIICSRKRKRDRAPNDDWAIEDEPHIIGR